MKFYKQRIMFYIDIKPIFQSVICYKVKYLQIIIFNQNTKKK